MKNTWMLCCIVVLEILMVQFLVKANFVLTVKLINYTNPTGLCAECLGGLEAVTSADQLTPVCCDESPFRSDNCDNTGEARCDTRFRWTLRPLDAPLETRPVSIPGVIAPPYYFTSCGLSPTTCPLNETTVTFNQGQTSFLGVEDNPLLVEPSPSTLTSWPGSVQFFIEAVDSGLPNIIDSLLINLDNLQLGADFTEERTFTGYHNISQMTMSFKVACQTGFCGKDCSIQRFNRPRISECHPNGDIVCGGSRYNPLAYCESCLHNLDFSTDCSTCLESNFDPDTNCTACLSGYDINTNCSTCLKSNYDPSKGCTQCFSNMHCSKCLFGFDISRDCSVCLPGRNISTNCTTCLSGYAGENCKQATDPSPTISSPLNTFLVGGIAGGVLTVLVIVIIVVVVVALLLTRKTGDGELHVREELQDPVHDVAMTALPCTSSDAVFSWSEVLSRHSTEQCTKDQDVYYIRTGIETKQNLVYGVSAVTVSVDTDAIQLQPNVLYRALRSDQTVALDYYESLQPQSNDYEECSDYTEVQ